MIDSRVLRSDPDRVRASQRARGESENLVDEVLAAEVTRRAAIAEYERQRAEQKELGRQIPRATGEERTALLSRTKELADLVKKATRTPAEAGDAFDGLLKRHRQPGHRRRPRRVARTTSWSSSSAADQARLRRRGFHVRATTSSGQILGAIDVERGAKVSGSRFYYLTGPGAVLELALINLAMSTAVANGFTPIIPPAAGEGRRRWRAPGSLARPRRTSTGPARATTSTWSERPEVPLAAYHTDEILDPAGSPPAVRRARAPASGARPAPHGKDTRGIFRVHWFDKVEMFSFCAPERGRRRARRGCWPGRRQFIDALELPYRVIDVAAGDLGLSAARKFDCEGWIADPGPLPGDHLDLELHHVPGAPAERPGSVRRRHRAGGHPERHPVRHDPNDHHAAGEPPAGRRLGAHAGRPAALSSAAASS